MEKYKHDIEAIVHPLIASEQRKNTLRRELWAHFCALADEERQAGSDETTAAGVALLRLGDPQAIREAYMRNIPRAERWIAHLERHPNETHQAYSRRMMVTMLPCLAVVPLCFGLQTTLAAPGHATIPWTIGVMLSVWMLVFFVLALRKTPRWESQLRSGARLRSVLGAFATLAIEGALLAAGCVALAYAAIAAWQGPFHSDALSIVYMGVPILAFEWVALTTCFAYALVRGTQAANIIPGWPYTT